MAGTLVATTLSDGTNSTSTTNAIQGSAKAWVNFNGVPASPTIRASYNVSSVTKITTGAYTVSFTNALPDANYCVSGGGGGAGTASGCWFSTGFNVGGVNTVNTTSSFRVQIYYATSATADIDYIYASVFR